MLVLEVDEDLEQRRLLLLVTWQELGRIPGLHRLGQVRLGAFLDLRRC